MPTVKSIQRGTILIKGLASNSTKIIAVDLGNSTLEWNGTATGEDYNGYYHAYAEMIDSTTVGVLRTGQSAQEYIYWKVTEYE